ncbi:hypothetical protein [Taibaiella soli]|uniref:Uncharacterized protein n=1 Tax=Taibaiella soli TaxID=1649169 RepID=A0A2W2AY61_9BACT|nr:hypothetical protein [Taibaiella soli]PZF72628.1 hypothetical protein DN068_12240 [Taibaiella soli]
MIQSARTFLAISNERKSGVERNLDAISAALEHMLASGFAFDDSMDIHDLFRIYQQLSRLSSAVTDAMIVSGDVAVLFQQSRKVDKKASCEL